MRAIKTRYGTNSDGGGRVHASCIRGRLSVGWDYALDTDGNHDAAARALTSKMGWDVNAKMHSAWLPNHIRVTVVEV